MCGIEGLGRGKEMDARGGRGDDEGAGLGLFRRNRGNEREREKAIKDGKWRLFCRGWICSEVHPEIWDYSTRCIKMCHRMHSVAWSRNLSALE